jgi:hypothetical protein
MWDAHDDLVRRAEMELRMCCPGRGVVKPVIEAAQTWVAKMTSLPLPFRPSLEYILDACVCTQRLYESVACALASDSVQVLSGFQVAPGEELRGNPSLDLLAWLSSRASDGRFAVGLVLGHSGACKAPAGN